MATRKKPEVPNKHGESCGSCCSFRRVNVPGTQASEVGECLLNPPIPFPMTDPETGEPEPIWMFPLVEPKDYCRQFKGSQ